MIPAISFRISVESVILHEEKVLLVKRAPNCKVAPNVWNVPAGKVNMLEITREAVIRETFEETGLRVRTVQLLSESAFDIMVANEKAFRNMFTYLTVPVDSNTEVQLNEEHTEYVWVTKDELQTDTYTSLMPRLKDILVEALTK